MRYLGRPLPLTHNTTSFDGALRTTFRSHLLGEVQRSPVGRAAYRAMGPFESIRARFWQVTVAVRRTIDEQVFGA